MPNGGILIWSQGWSLSGLFYGRRGRRNASMGCGTLQSYFGPGIDGGGRETARQFGRGGKVKVFTPSQEGTQGKSTAATRRALTWKSVNGKKNAAALLVAKAYQDPDLKDGNVEIRG